LFPSWSKISQVNNLIFDKTEYDAEESNAKEVEVFHFSGVCLSIATGSEITM
jgi:hypothetical protein